MLANGTQVMHVCRSTYTEINNSFKMQQVHSNREQMSEVTNLGDDSSSVIVRTDLSSLLSEYTSSQRRCNDRLESLERQMVSLKGQVNEVITSSNEQELNRTYSVKKGANPPPISARGISPSRIPLPVTPRRLSNDEKPVTPTNNKSTSHHLPSMPAVVRSKSFHPKTSDESPRLRSHKIQLEQTRFKDSADLRIPNYSSVEEVIKANEQLLLENDCLRSDFNRLKTENILLLRSMKATTTGNEPSFGNERILAERERQDLATELTRQVDENKRLRKSLLAQSAKFITLRQSMPLSSSSEYRFTSQSVTQPSPNSSRAQKAKSARCNNSSNRGYDRTNTFYHSSYDQL